MPFATTAGLLALLPALAIAATACGVGETVSAEDAQACLEDAGFEVEHTAKNPEEDSGRTDEPSYSIGEFGAGYKGGTAVFYESAEGAEGLFTIKEHGPSFTDQVFAIKGNVVYDLGTKDENDPDFAKVGGCF